MGITLISVITEMTGFFGSVRPVGEGRPMGRYDEEDGGEESVGSQRDHRPGAGKVL